MRTTSQWYDDGLTLLDSGFLESAVECFDRVLQAEPRDAKAWALKARALSGMESYEEAVECLDAALELDPLDAQAWSEKASCLTRLGREDEAARCEREAQRSLEGQETVSTARTEPVASIYGVANGLVSDTVSIIAADEKEAWFAYKPDQGVTRLTLNDRRVQSYVQGVGLTSSGVRCIVLAQEAVWLGTDQGLSRFDRGTESWTHFNEETGLNARIVNDVVADSELLWLGTGSGLLVMDSTTGKSVACPGGPDPREIDHLVGDGDRIWCGANHERAGLSVFDKSTETFESLDVGPWVQGMQLFPLGDTQELWVARRDGITIVDRTTCDTREIPLPAMVVTGMAIGGNHLMVGTDQGLTVVEVQEGQVLVKESEIGLDQRVTAVCATRSREWVAIEGQGVLCLIYS